MENAENSFLLYQKDGRIYYQASNDQEPVPARIVLAAPLSAGTSVVSIMHANKKSELVLLTTLDGVEDHSRKIIEDEIRKKYFLPEILKVNEINIHLGDYFWDVITDRGSRKFLLSSPVISVRLLGNQRLLLNDTDGLYYEIPDIKSLDQQSQRFLENVI